jgi:hypothetical protein
MDNLLSGSVPVYLYHKNGRELIQCKEVYPDDADYFIENNIKVSMEHLAGTNIVYGCPVADTSEESEVIVLANDKTCKETLKELASLCKHSFGDCRG